MRTCTKAVLKRDGRLGETNTCRGRQLSKCSPKIPAAELYILNSLVKKKNSFTVQYVLGYRTLLITLKKWIQMMDPTLLIRSVKKIFRMYKSGLAKFISFHKYTNSKHL